MFRNTDNDWLKPLTDIQKEHLDKASKFLNNNKPCLHNSCTSCHGTGVKLDGTACVHGISCPCSKCSPYSY